MMMKTELFDFPVDHSGSTTFDDGEIDVVGGML
jgi:hypothetical protein